MPKLHIIEGPVGAGKTTFAMKLGFEYKTPPLVLDEWMVTLFRKDRPDSDIWTWYAERKQRCQAQIWSIARNLLELEHDAIVELGLLKSEDRYVFYSLVEAAGHDYCVYVLEASKSERWRRVQERNVEQGATFSMEVSEDVFNLASDAWEPLSEEECRGRDVQFVND